MTRLSHIRDLLASAKVEALAAEDLASVPRLRDRGEKHKLWACFYVGRVDVAFENYERETR